MAKQFLTDEEVEREIAQLSETDEVRIARKELRLKYKRRQTLYSMRALYKRGEQLFAAGVTLENIEALTEAAEALGE